MKQHVEEQRRKITATPENSETPLEAICSWVTPTRLFFVRNHFDVPTLDVSDWRLTIDGCVERPTVLSWEQLNDLPRRSVFATVECAGNGRSFLNPPVKGVQWGAGAIAHAEWTGVPLHIVLQKAGIKAEAVEVVFTGADRGCEAGQTESMAFRRSLPLSKAMHDQTLLALHMNGEQLEPNHGYPLRLLVPGWYGVASVKWLTGIEVLDKPFEGYYQTKKYTIRTRTADGTKVAPVQSMAIKTEVIRPRPGEILGLGRPRVFDVAWAGEDVIARVQVSTDGGEYWHDAELLGPRAPYAWTLWEYLWDVSAVGSYNLLVRATSTSGHIQPLTHDPLCGGYMINFSRPIPVRVEADRKALAMRGDAITLLYDMNAFAEANARVPLDVHLEFSEGAGI